MFLDFESSKLMLSKLTPGWNLSRTPKSALEWIQMAGLGQQERWFHRCCWGVKHHVSHSKDVTTANHCFTEYPEWPLQNRLWMDGQKRNDLESCEVHVLYWLPILPPKVYNPNTPENSSFKRLGLSSHFPKGVRNPSLQLRGARKGKNLDKLPSLKLTAKANKSTTYLKNMSKNHLWNPKAELLDSNSLPNFCHSLFYLPSCYVWAITMKGVQSKVDSPGQEFHFEVAWQVKQE